MFSDKTSSFLIISLFCFFILFPPEIYDPSFSIFIIASSLLFMLTLLKKNQVNPLAALALFIIIYFLLLQSLFANKLQLSYVMLFIAYCILFFSLHHLLTVAITNSIVYTIVFLVLFLSLYAFYQFFYGYQHDYASLLPYKDSLFIGKTLAYLQKKRVTASFALPTVFSAFLMTALPFSIHAIIAFKSRIRICAIVSTLLALLAALLSP